MIYNVNYIKTINNEIKKVNSLIEEEYQIPIEILEPIINPSEKETLLLYKKEKEDKYNLNYSQYEYKENVLKYIIKYLENISFNNLYGKNVNDFLQQFLEIFKNDLNDRVKGKYILGRNKNYIVANRLNYYKNILRKVNDVITDMGERLDILSGFDVLITTLNTINSVIGTSKGESREAMIIKGRNDNYLKSIFKFNYDTDFIDVINSISSEYKVVGSSDLLNTIEIINGNSVTVLDRIIDIFNAKFEEIERICKTIISSSIIISKDDQIINIDAERIEIMDNVVKSFFIALENSEFYKSINYLYNKTNESFGYINKLVNY